MVIQSGNSLAVRCTTRTKRRRRWALRTGALAFGVALLLPRAGSAQPLTLGEALRRAETGAYGNRLAQARAQAQAGDALRPLQGILPSVRVEAGYMRTTDPVGAFGTTLRQRTITQADFDPARLNYPSVAPNHTAALVVEQPLLNVDAHLGRRAATLAAEAATHAAQWTRANTEIDVVLAYYGAVLVHEQVATLETALAAAEAHVRQAEAMVKQGVVTKSDALLARVRAGELRVQLLEARGTAALSRRELAVLLGEPGDTSFALATTLPAASAIAGLERLSWTVSPEARSDVQAARAGAAAARADERRARSLLLPRLNAVARYDWNAAAGPFQGEKNWSLGVMATWSPFAGASQLAELRGASARADAAATQEEAARAQAELSVAAAANAWSVAVERVRIAESAVAQSVEAHRIVARKYDGGLAAIVELLGAAAAETEARLRHSHARYQAIVAAAERLQGLGHGVAELASLLSDN